MPKVIAINYRLLYCWGAWSTGESCLHRWPGLPHVVYNSPITLYILAGTCNVQQHRRLPSQSHCLNYCYCIPKVAARSTSGMTVSFYIWYCAQHDRNCIHAGWGVLDCAQRLSRDLRDIVNSVQSVNVLTKALFCACYSMPRLKLAATLEASISLEEITLQQMLRGRVVEQGIASCPPPPPPNEWVQDEAVMCMPKAYQGCWQAARETREDVWS